MTRPTRTPRMRDVAALAGVGTMTVSRVINGNAHVTEETRKRVSDAVRQLNYQPNEVARSLRDQKSRQIGVIIPNLHDPFFALCAQAVSLVAKGHGYSVNIAMSDEDLDTEYDEAILMLRRNVEGMVVIPCAGKASRLTAAEFSKVPIVALDRPLTSRRFDSVLVENHVGAKIAVEHLIGLGHRRIAFLGLSAQLYTIRERCEGYREAMQRAGLKVHVCYGNYTPEEMVVSLRTMLREKDAPTALFSSNNLQTRHALHALLALGIAVPDEIALVGFDDFEMADLLQPPVTVVRQPNLDIGRVGTDMLFARLAEENGGRREGEHVVLPVELVVRNSCGRGPAAAMGSHDRAHAKQEDVGGAVRA